MNAGLSSLSQLKKAIMPDALRANAMYDDALVSLGLGVAEAMESYLDRKLAWMVGDTTEQDAQRIIISVPRYPVAAFTAVEVQRTPTGAWEDIMSSVTRLAKASGLVCFRNAPGDESATLRVTYSAGFWWDTEEEGGGTMPEGAEPLPAALFQAWVMQIQARCNALDLFGAQAGKDTNTLGAGSNLLANAQEFIPAVETTLKRFRRMSA